jgi:hypothetical protein
MTVSIKKRNLSKSKTNAKSKSTFKSRKTSKNKTRKMRGGSMRVKSNKPSFNTTVHRTLHRTAHKTRPSLKLSHPETYGFNRKHVQKGINSEHFGRFGLTPGKTPVNHSDVTTGFGRFGSSTRHHPFMPPGYLMNKSSTDFSIFPADLNSGSQKYKGPVNRDVSREVFTGFE